MCQTVGMADCTNGRMMCHGRSSLLDGGIRSRFASQWPRLTRPRRCLVWSMTLQCSTRLRSPAAARAAANAPVIEQARVTRALRSLIDGMNAEIQDRLPAKLRQTVAAIAANVTLRAQTVTDRAAQAAIAADDTKTRAERQAARDERDRLIAEIERIDAELVADRAWRDGYAVMIAAQRAARDASAAELVNERAELDARRVTRAAAIVAINGG